MQGYIHSLESFGTVDGPGVRYVVFFQGCPMRCKYCHNPDTWNLSDGKLMKSEEIIENLVRNGEFYKTGGITATGGEPLLQIEFLIDLFSKAKEKGIHTCIDTSGILYDPTNNKKMELFQRLVKVTDLVMLDIKHMDEKEHISLTGHSNLRVFEFARFLEEHKVPIWIRHVVVPGITNEPEEWKQLGEFLRSLTNFRKLEVLPYHSMAKDKYQKLGMNYPLMNTKDLSKEDANIAYQEIMDEYHRAYE